MSDQSALLTFSIGPVHTFIEQARRLADQWAGSQILSHLIATVIGTLRSNGGTMVFPYVADDADIPKGLPNRFVCSVPADVAERVAKTMRDAVLGEWVSLTKKAVEVLSDKDVGLRPELAIWSDSDTSQQREYADRTIEVAWSFVAEDSDYAAASRQGAETFAASRLFRPFVQIDERGEKCAVCGERTALPDGKREQVREAWRCAEKTTKNGPLGPYFREDQGRLCLVCATKRLFPRLHGNDPVVFEPFNAFEPREEKPYIAVVKMDGDKMGEVLGWSDILSASAEDFHKKVSEALSRFSEDLHGDPASKLNLAALGNYKCRGKETPALIYAGGDDVLFVCDPRDGLPLARLIREKYRKDFQAVKDIVGEERYRKLTISAGILFAHSKQPASLMFRDVEDLLKQVAKDREGRDAVAVRLAKRGGTPVEVAFKWDDEETGRTWVANFDDLVARLLQGSIASGQSFSLAEEEETLSAVLTTSEDWTAWLTERLSRGAGSSAEVDKLAKLISPFFVARKTEALRIARFLGREVGS